MTLKLRDIDTKTPHIENPNLDYFYELIEGKMTCAIDAEDIKCSNEEEILDALHRKSKQYFYNVNYRGDTLVFCVRVGRSFFGLGSRGPEQIENARKNMEESVQNTVDDVFGVGCVEVE